MAKLSTHIPFYAQAGFVTIRKWTEPFEDRNGNKALVTKVEYLDLKKKKHEVVIRVAWEIK